MSRKQLSAQVVLVSFARVRTRQTQGRRGPVHPAGMGSEGTRGLRGRRSEVVRGPKWVPPVARDMNTGTLECYVYAPAFDFGCLLLGHPVWNFFVSPTLRFFIFHKDAPAHRFFVVFLGWFVQLLLFFVVFSVSTLVCFQCFHPAAAHVLRARPQSPVSDVFGRFPEVFVQVSVLPRSYFTHTGCFVSLLLAQRD